jgi:hypothetical protein
VSVLPIPWFSISHPARASKVDLKKLEKQEAKIRSKFEKREKRGLQYEGSKLIDAQRKQVCHSSFVIAFY